MKKALPLVLLLCVTLYTSCHKAPPSGDKVMMVDSGDAEMNSAMARARAEVDTFLEKMKEDGVHDPAVKIPISENGQTEYFWITNLSFADGVFTGKIDNDPELVHNVKSGQTVTVKKSEIADWSYFKGDKLYGNYTLRVLMKKMPPEEAEQYRKILAD